MKNLLGGRSPLAALFALCNLWLMPYFWTILIFYLFLNSPYEPNVENTYPAVYLAIAIAVGIGFISLVLLGSFYGGILRKHLYPEATRKSTLLTILPFLVWALSVGGVLIYDSLSMNAETPDSFYMKVAPLKLLEEGIYVWEIFLPQPFVSGYDALLWATLGVGALVFLFYYIYLLRAAVRQSPRAVLYTLLTVIAALISGAALYFVRDQDLSVVTAVAVVTLLFQVYLWAQVICAFAERPLLRYGWLLGIMLMFPVGSFLFSVGSTYYADMEHRDAVGRIESAFGRSLSMADFKQYYNSGPTPNAERFFGIDPTADTAYTALKSAVDAFCERITAPDSFDEQELYLRSPSYVDTEMAMIREWLISIDTEIKHLNRLTELPYFRPSFYDSPLFVEQYVFAPMLTFNAVKLYQTCFVERLDAADTAGALEMWDRLHRVEILNDPTAMLTGLLVALVLPTYRYMALVTMIEKGVVDDLLLQREQRALRDCRARLPSWYMQAWGNETVGGMQTGEEFFKPENIIPEYLTLLRYLPANKRIAFAPGYYMWRMAMTNYCRHFAAVLSDMKRWERGELEATAFTAHEKESFTMRGLVFRSLYDMPEITAKSTDRTIVKMNCAIAGLAVERYRLKHGRLPEKLVDLVPEFLDTVPLDIDRKRELVYEQGELKVDEFQYGHPTVNGYRVRSRYRSGSDDEATNPAHIDACFLVTLPETDSSPVH